LWGVKWVTCQCDQTSWHGQDTCPSYIGHDKAQYVLTFCPALFCLQQDYGLAQIMGQTQPLLWYLLCVLYAFVPILNIHMRKGARCIYER
jgi:hypothetical protein